MATNTCAKCGSEINGNTAVCQACGTPVSPRNKTNPIKLVAMLVVIAAGVILAVFIRTREPVFSDDTNPAAPVVDLEKVKAQAEAGDTKAQNLLGQLYAKGESVTMDYKEAAKWYRLAADKGDAEAQKRLAQLYEVGQGVPRDEAEAAKLFQSAAEKGNVDAQYSLGAMYTSGRGVPPNAAEAVKWYRLAAEQGDSLAQFTLGQRSIAGAGLPKDPVEAFKWLSLASAQGLPDATQALDGLKKSMSSSQLSEGQSRVQAFSVKAQNKPAR